MLTGVFLTRLRPIETVRFYTIGVIHSLSPSKALIFQTNFCKENSGRHFAFTPMYIYTSWRETMFQATIEIASEIAHDLNVSREFVWEIIQGTRYDSIEELEIKVCKAIVSH